MKNDLPAGLWEQITPKKAEQYLQLNLDNRKLRQGVAEKYARDMTAGKWVRNPQPILFYADGSLADGQHRLWAVVMASVSVWFYVIRDVQRDVALNLDTGLGRSLTDNARIGGWEKPLSHNIIAMAIFVRYGTRRVGHTPTNAERLEIIDNYEEHLVWADRHMPRKKYVGQAAVAAAVARAHMHERDLERLAKFCEQLGTGLPEGEQDHAVSALRTYLFTGGSKLAADPRDLFLKSMNAVRYFMRRKPLTVVKGVKDEAYPLTKKS